jgi:hypothetical protein
VNEWRRRELLLELRVIERTEAELERMEDVLERKRQRILRELSQSHEKTYPTVSVTVR